MTREVVKVAVVIAGASGLLMTGCSTKRYGREAPVSSLEAAKYDCEDLSIEVAKVEEFLAQIERGSQIDGRSVLGFLGDFGIGNAVEKNEATKSGQERLRQLRQLQAQKGCL